MFPGNKPRANRKQIQQPKAIISDYKEIRLSGGAEQLLPDHDGATRSQKIGTE